MSQDSCGDCGLTEEDSRDLMRWRWLTNDCDGDGQDDFIRWLSGTVASRRQINAKIDEFMQPRLPPRDIPE